MSKDLLRIAELRAKGKAPRSVTIWLDGRKEPKRGLRWFETDAPADVFLDDAADVGLLDLRPLIRLDVQVFAYRYASRVVRLSDRLKEVANTVLVAIGDDDDLDGWTWIRGREQAAMFDVVGTVEWCRAQRHIQAARRALA